MDERIGDCSQIQKDLRENCAFGIGMFENQNSTIRPSALMGDLERLSVWVEYISGVVSRIEWYSCRARGECCPWRQARLLP